MSHTIRDKQKLKARTNKIQGQVTALKKCWMSRMNAQRCYNKSPLSVVR
jgi:DNA-binding FrmR family transcriptional regulator